MKITVVRCDGDYEVLDLAEGSCRVAEHNKFQWKLHTSDGVDHYFRLEDGRYDGWGKAAPMGGWSEETAKAFAASFERNRVIVGRKRPEEKIQ